MLKAELRKFSLQTQKELSVAETADKCSSLAQNFFDDLTLREINYLHCFLPIRRNNEIDTYIILQKIWHDSPHIETYAPRVNFVSNEIENLKFTRETELALSDWQIHEPLHDEKIASEKIDMVLVPLLAFDERGYRVGYGRGFYDRFLAQCRPDVQKVGLSYFPPVAKIDDVNEFDIKLNRCITPDKVWHF